MSDLDGSVGGGADEYERGYEHKRSPAGADPAAAARRLAAPHPAIPPPQLRAGLDPRRAARGAETTPRLGADVDRVRAGEAWRRAASGRSLHGLAVPRAPGDRAAQHRAQPPDPQRRARIEHRVGDFRAEWLAGDDEVSIQGPVTIAEQRILLARYRVARRGSDHVQSWLPPDRQKTRQRVGSIALSVWTRAVHVVDKLASGDFGRATTILDESKVMYVSENS